MATCIGFVCPKCGWEYSPVYGYLVPNHLAGASQVGKFLDDLLGAANPKAQLCMGSGRAAIVEGPHHERN